MAKINCSICNEVINGNSQFINGKYYHNECIESVINKLNSIKELCLEKRNHIKEMENFYKECSTDKGRDDFASEFCLLLKYDLTLLDIINIIEK